MRHFEPEDKLRRTQVAFSTELDEETVLMSIDAGAYYGLAGTARVIWAKIETPLTFSALVDELVKEYDIAPEVCSAELEKFLGQMEQEGLLHVE